MSRQGKECRVGCDQTMALQRHFVCAALADSGAASRAALRWEHCIVLSTYA